MLKNGSILITGEIGLLENIHQNDARQIQSSKTCNIF